MRLLSWIHSSIGRVVRSYSSHRFLEWVVLVFVIYLSVIYWLNHLFLSPDSTSYITASENLVTSGRLEIYVNYRDWRTDPEPQPYTDQPPGFPLLLIPFMAVMEPIHAAVYAQCLYIAVFFFAMYAICRQLGISTLNTILLLLLTVLLSPFRAIFSTFWTETIFTAVSLYAGVLLIRMVGRQPSVASWWGLMSLFVIGSSLKYTGAANLFLLSPILLQPESLQAAKSILRYRYTSLSLIALGLAIVSLSIGVDLLPSAKVGIGRSQVLGLGIGIGLFILGFGLGWINRMRRSRGEGRYWPRTWTLHHWTILAVLAAALPIPLWLLRNQLFHGYTTLTHNLFDAFHQENLLVPFQFLWENVLSIRWVPSILLVTILLFFAAVPVLWGTQRHRQIQWMLIGGTAGHFAMVWLPSLVARFDPVSARLLSTSLAFGMLVVFYGMHVLHSHVLAGVNGLALSMFPAAYLVLNHGIRLDTLLPSPLEINLPVERALWQALNEDDRFKDADYFYSDFNYHHQIFSSRPQAVLWQTEVLEDPSKVREILTRESDVFILLHTGGYEWELLEKTRARDMPDVNRVPFPQFGFSAYRIQPVPRISKPLH